MVQETLKHRKPRTNPNAFELGLRARRLTNARQSYTWVVVKIIVPFWVLNIIRHLKFRVPKKGPKNFHNYPHPKKPATSALEHLPTTPEP